MRTRHFFLLFLLACLLLISGAQLMTWLQTEPATAETITTIGLESAVTHHTTDELLIFWQNRVEQQPHDPISLAYLGQTYWQKGRETGDVDSYNRAQATLEQALALKPDDELALSLLATVKLAQHDFAGALDLAQRVYAFDAGALQALATMGDAHLELGQYAEAEAAFQTLHQKSDNPAVYSRLARLAWIQGKPQDSLTHMQSAVEAARSLKLSGEQLAWYEAQLGELYFNTGQLAAAQTQYRNAADTFENYYLASAGLGKVQAAQGDLDTAITLYEQLVTVLPQPEFIARLGDWYALNGDPTAAQEQYETINIIAELEAANAILTNRQLALFYANHDQNLAEALTLAERELASRGDVYAYDTVAWALYKNGRFSEAATAVEQALASGTQDAQLAYHAGMIYAAQNQTTKAEQFLQQALTLNPYFDQLQAEIAQETLAQLTAVSAEP